uniref:Electron transfer flavoprotein alpha subunit C-terminal domain-containing protein n=1 Tax=Physcomitrium patens TaxID=3218 RepID=A0A2K1JDN2_PHYPA|nr:hypothetical protein PHYPA_019915 [Physcomitrium patens]
MMLISYFGGSSTEFFNLVIIAWCKDYRSIYAGNALPAVRYVGSGPCIFSIRPTSFAVSSALPREAEAPISALDTSGLNAEIIERSEWLGQQVQESERPELGSARVVVSGGRGLKSKESFEMLEKLADELGGAVGALRAAVDEGYLPNDLLVMDSFSFELQSWTVRLVSMNLLEQVCGACLVELLIC